MWQEETAKLKKNKAFPKCPLEEQKPGLSRHQRLDSPTRPDPTQPWACTPGAWPTCSHSEAEFFSAVQALNLPCLSSRA